MERWDEGRLALFEALGDICDRIGKDDVKGTTLQYLSISPVSERRLMAQSTNIEPFIRSRTLNQKHQWQRVRQRAARTSTESSNRRHLQK